MLVLAHRGANRLAPENTLPAMVRAVEAGADGIELDVHRSADGVLVVRHDAESPAGLLADLTLDAIRAALPEVPALADVLDACAGRMVNVEVKDADPRVVDDLLALLAARRAAGRADVVLVSSFHLEVVDRVRTAAGGSVPTGFLSFGLDPHSALAVVHEHGHDAVHPDVWTLVQAHGAGVDVAAFVTRAHELGVRVHVWTVNDVAQVEQLRDAGVDAVITDDDALYAFGATGRRP